MRKIIITVFLLMVLLNNNWLGYNLAKASNNQLKLTEINELHTGSRTVDIFVNGNVLYALDSDLGLQIYNISDPTAIIRLGSLYDAYTFSHGLAYYNELIFIADYEDKLEIVNVSDPTSPQIIGRYQEIDNSVQWIGSTNLHVIRDLVFLASQNEGMEIIDVGDPTNPVEIGSYYAGNSINVVYSIDTLAFIRERGGSFKILNISDLTSPVEIYHMTGVSVGQNFFVMDNLLYIPDMDFGLRIYDITNPSYIINAYLCLYFKRRRWFDDIKCHKSK
ncbi:MAG: LVIVD repeat-containing protein [Candidatus Hodarchaeales archaeon]